MQATHTPAIGSAQAAIDRKRQALRIEVAHHYAWEARKWAVRYAANERPKMVNVRLRQLERLFRRRWGYTLPADDAGLGDLKIAAHHMAHYRGDVRHYIIAWAQVWAPWLPQEAAEAIAAEVMEHPLKWRAGTLGRLLRLTRAERKALGITTIRAFDMNNTELKEQRKTMQAGSSRNYRARKAIDAGRVPGVNGRPRKSPGPADKNPSTADIDSIGVDGFSARTGGAPLGTGQRAARPLKGRAPQAAAPRVVFLFTAEAQRQKTPGVSLRRNVLRPLLSRLPAARPWRAGA